MIVDPRFCPHRIRCIPNCAWIWNLHDMPGADPFDSITYVCDYCHRTWSNAQVGPNPDQFFRHAENLPHSD